MKKVFLGITCVVFLSLFFTLHGFGQEDKIVHVAIETVRVQMRIPQGMEVKFIEKQESQIPDFYSVKLIVFTPEKEVPLVLYVDKAGEKVILGSLLIKGENVTRKEAGEPKPRKIDMGQLEIEKSPFRGQKDAKVVVVEFSNFHCPYCVKSWKKMKELLEKNPPDIKYVFKHFPFQPPGKSSDLSEMVASVQEVSGEAFWAVHDFFFSDEGQPLINGEKEALKKKIEEILQGKGYDVKVFQTALETGKGKKKVEEDMAVGRKIPVLGTPSAIVNGEFVGGGVTEKVLERYQKK